MNQEIREYMASVLQLDDVETQEMLYGEFLSTCDENLARIAAAISAGNSADLRFAAHALKGCAANIGYSEMSRICKEMELIGADGQTDCGDRLERVRELRKVL